MRDRQRLIAGEYLGGGGAGVGQQSHPAPEQVPPGKGGGGVGHHPQGESHPHPPAADRRWLPGGRDEPGSWRRRTLALRHTAAVGDGDDLRSAGLGPSDEPLQPRQFGDQIGVTRPVDGSSSKPVEGGRTLSLNGHTWPYQATVTGFR